jgi:hypothetical protein
MSQLENTVWTKSQTSDQSHVPVHKLSEEALMIASTATLALAAAALVVESKGRALPALVEAGERLAADAGERVGVASGEALERRGGSLIPEILKPKASAFSGDVENVELGARPAPQYGQGAKAMDASHLAFIDKWPVEGVRVHGDAVDLYVTKNGHWLELKNFQRPFGERGLFGQPPLPVQPLDLLNTQVRNIRVTPRNPFAGLAETTEGQKASITLTRGAMHEINLTGNVKITEFWQR